MTQITTETPTTRLRALPADRSHAFTIEPDAETRAKLAQTLGISGLRKLRFTGQLQPENRADWRLRANLGATVIQPCVVTLEPVTTRIDTEIARLYTARPEVIPDTTEVEMPEDDSVEPMPEVLDLFDVLTEALALALPDYPRADGAALEQAQFAEPGVAPMTDEDAKPFAALAALKAAQKKE
ncbi:YceD family protein [Actibacterium ureilyticum]|uniref:YceD family protein n=1 Tax=Actibacterium ureilyticum TaxID=1590614 RepID=UPI000BAB0B76|nr:DUF177 domain-containing protein [Actibacterium ureilyticum]